MMDDGVDVRVASFWRLGAAGPVWMAEDENVREVLLVRWARGVRVDGELERVEQRVPRESLTHGDGGWRLASAEEALEAYESMPAGERAAMPSVAAVAGDGVREYVPTHPVRAKLPASTEGFAQGLADAFGPDVPVRHRGRVVRPSEVMAAEEQRLRDELLRGPLAVMRDLRDAKRDLVEYAGPSLTQGVKVATALVSLVEAAEGTISELFGPAFAAWRCDECGNVVSDPHVPVAISRALDVRAVYKDGELEYVECVNGGEHGPMRHVLCRVTADSPDSLLGASG